MIKRHPLAAMNVGLVMMAVLMAVTLRGVWVDHVLLSDPRLGVGTFTVLALAQVLHVVEGQYICWMTRELWEVRARLRRSSSDGV